MKILCLGHLTYDITLPVTQFPIENTKTKVETKNEGAGGPATIAAFLLSKWGLDVTMAGLVGNDHYGNVIKKELSLNRINTDYLEISDSYETSTSVNIANNESGSRTLLVYDKKGEQMPDFDLDFNPDIILIDGHDYEASKSILKKYPKAISVIDAGKDKKEILDLCKITDYIVCSKEFAESVSGLKIDYENKHTLVDVYKRLESEFKGKVIITLEEKGCLYRLENKIKLMPSIKVKAVDTVGAGDIFHGAFVYGLANGFDLEKTLKYSNIAGCLSVTKIGNYDSIPNLKEVEEIYEEIG